MFNIACIICLALLAYLIQTVNTNITVNTSVKCVELRKSLIPVIDDDVARVWKSFFESYLFVYANSKMVPNEKEFLEFRTSFIDMFYIMIGSQQCDLYSSIFKGDDYFKIYLYHAFEKHFKNVFVEIIIDQTVLNDGKKMPSNNNNKGG